MYLHGLHLFFCFLFFRCYWKSTSFNDFRGFTSTRCHLFRGEHHNCGTSRVRSGETFLPLLHEQDPLRRAGPGAPAGSASRRWRLGRDRDVEEGRLELQLFPHHDPAPSAFHIVLPVPGCPRRQELLRQHSAGDTGRDLVLVRKQSRAK